MAKCVAASDGLSLLTNIVLSPLPIRFMFGMLMITVCLAYVGTCPVYDDLVNSCRYVISPDLAVPLSSTEAVEVVDMVDVDRRVAGRGIVGRCADGPWYRCLCLVKLVNTVLWEMNFVLRFARGTSDLVLHVSIVLLGPLVPTNRLVYVRNRALVLVVGDDTCGTGWTTSC